MDGSGEPEALIRSASDPSAAQSRALAGLLPGSMPVFTSANPHLPMSWSPDGLTLAFDERKPSAEHDIWVLTRGSEPSPFQMTPNDESSPTFSPDGKWLAYVSDETGRSAVWVQPFPGPGRQVARITRRRDRARVVAGPGPTLYFRRSNQLVSVPITPGAEFRWGKTAASCSNRGTRRSTARATTTSAPDGKSFVVVRSEGADDADQFNVVLNWFAELRSRK